MKSKPAKPIIHVIYVYSGKDNQGKNQWLELEMAEDQYNNLLESLKNSAHCFIRTTKGALVYLPPNLIYHL